MSTAAVIVSIPAALAALAAAAWQETPVDSQRGRALPAESGRPRC